MDGARPAEDQEHQLIIMHRANRCRLCKVLLIAIIVSADLCADVKLVVDAEKLVLQGAGLQAAPGRASAIEVRGGPPVTITPLKP